MSLTVTDQFALQREHPWTFGEEWNQSPSGLYVPGGQQRPTYPTAVDLFAGAGGFSLGFHQAGFHVVGALEYDFWASMTYLANLGSPDTELIFVTGEDKERFEKEVAKARKKDKGASDSMVERDQWGSGWRASALRELADPDLDADLAEESATWCAEPCEVFVFGDARKVKGSDFLAWLGVERDEITAIMGGPPCQSFSRSGKRNVMDPRNSLVFDFMRLVTEMRPQVFLMENVPGMLDMVTPEGTSVVDAICRIAQDGGFGNYDAIKKSLLSMNGVGALSGKPESVHKSKRQPKKQSDDGQGALAL